MNDMRMQLLEKQSEVNKVFNEIVKIIVETIPTEKKITKRELDKVNAILMDKYGAHGIMTNGGAYAKYTVSLDKRSYGSTLCVFSQDRYITVGDNTSYIPEYMRTIFLDKKTGGIDVNTIEYATLPTPTRAEIRQAFKRIEERNKQIEELKGLNSGEPFHYYYNN